MDNVKIQNSFSYGSLHTRVLVLECALSSRRVLHANSMSSFDQKKGVLELGKLLKWELLNETTKPPRRSRGLIKQKHDHDCQKKNAYRARKKQERFEDSF